MHKPQPVATFRDDTKLPAASKIHFSHRRRFDKIQRQATCSQLVAPVFIPRYCCISISSNLRFSKKVTTLVAFSRKCRLTNLPMYEPTAAHSLALCVGKTMGCGLKAICDVSGRNQYESTQCVLAKE